MDTSMTESYNEKYSSMPSKMVTSQTRGKPRPMSSKTTASGAVDEAAFAASFEQVPTLQIFNTRDMSDHLAKVQSLIKQPDEDWEKRIEGLRLIRAILMCGSDHHDDFLAFLRTNVIPMQVCLSDLRSQVIREGCVTVGYLSEKLRTRLDHFGESVMNSLFNLVPNSAKIMSSCGVMALKYLIKNVESMRLIPPIVLAVSSKAGPSRRCACELLELICTDWSPHLLEKHMPLIQSALRKGINDSDQTARAAARRAFCGFALNFTTSASALLDSLDAGKRKIVETEMVGKPGLESLLRSGGGGGQTESTMHTGSLPRRMVKSSSLIKPASALHTTGSTTSANSHLRPYQADNYRRTDNRKSISQSQPVSRETSPTPQRRPLPPASILPSNHTSRMAPPRPGTRSQISSRETSPTGRSTANSKAPRSDSMSDLLASSAGGRSRRNSAGKLVPYQRKNSNGMSVTEMLLKDSKNRLDRYDSDDNMSETSSLASECSSRGSAHCATEVLSEILTQLNSNQWTDRKSGLLNINNYLQMQPPQPLSPHDINQLTNIFNKFFTVSQSKLVILFLDALQLLIRDYNSFIHDWLYTLLLFLLNKQGNDVLASHQKRIAETLQTIKTHFPAELQFHLCCKLLLDPCQQPTLKARVCYLNYMRELTVVVSETVLDRPGQEVKMALSKIISSAMEPKSVEIRKTASRLLAQLFQLNESGCTALVDALPRSFQDSAYKTLNSAVVTGGTGQRRRSSGAGAGYASGSLQRKSLSREQRDNGLPPDGRSGIPLNPGGSSYLNAHDIESYCRQTTADIQALSMTGSQSSYDKSFKSTAYLSPSSSAANRRRLSSDQGGTEPANQNRFHSAGNGGSRTDYLSNQSPGGNYSNGSLKSGVRDNTNIGSMPRLDKYLAKDSLADTLQEMASPTDRNDTRAARMLKLMRAIRDKSTTTWDTHFRTTLQLLLENVNDDVGEIRALSLRVLNELIACQPGRLKEYVHLTLVKIIEAHNDEDRTVVRAAEEVSQSLADNLSSDLCLSVLEPMILDIDSPVALPAIKVGTKVVLSAHTPTLRSHLPTLTTGLVKGCNHENSHLRKNSIFCLVELYYRVGDELWEHLGGLHNSKIRLLKLYIERARENRAT